jgi:Uma2 family endonuclease
MDADAREPNDQLPNDIHSPEYVAAVAARILAHVDEIPELTAAKATLKFEATPQGLLMQAAPDADHGRLLLRLRSRLNRGLGNRSSDQAEDGYIEVLENIGVQLGASERVPDLVVVDWPRHVDVREGKVLTPAGILMVAEVTSARRDQDLNAADPTAKPRQYAAAGIPLYLVVDRKDAQVVLFAKPEYGEYPEPVVHPVGESVWLPKPFGFRLDTEFMKSLM